MIQSAVTLQPLPTLKEALTEILSLYLQENGHKEFFDLTQVLESESEVLLAQSLVSIAQDLNVTEMLRNYQCPDCGTKLQQFNGHGDWKCKRCFSVYDEAEVGRG